MNYLSDSRYFQEVGSFCSGKLSHVPSQPAVVPSLCGIVSCDQSLRLDTWSMLRTSGNVFASPRAPIDSSSTPYQGMLHSWNQSGTGENPVRDSTRKAVARRKEPNRDTIPTPRFARKPAEGAYPQNYMVDQQKLQISQSFNLTNSPTTLTCSCRKIRFKTHVSACSGSPSEAMLWIKEAEMVDSVDEFKSSHSIQGFSHFQNFVMLDARIVSALNKIIQNSYFKKKVSPEEQKAQKENRFRRGRQIAYMIHDHFRVTGAHDTVLHCADLFTVTFRNDDVQEFATRSDEMLLSMTTHLMTSWIVSTN